MKRKLITMAFACFLGISYAQEIVHVHILYSGGGPQGDYLLAADSENRFSLKSILTVEESPDVEIGGIIPTLEEKYPHLAKQITVTPIEPKVADLIQTGKILIVGQIKNSGIRSPSTLGAGIAEAVPTEFGSIKRVQLIRDGISSTYDISQQVFAKVKLQPGDIVLVAMKRLLGR